MKSSLKTRVMARIYLEYTKNLVAEYPDYLMFLFFMTAAFAFVSVRNVLENIPKNNFIGAVNFFIVAVKNTSWVLKALIAGFVVRISTVGSIAAYKNIKAAYVRWWSSKPRLNSSNVENGSF